jgi:predicted aspartyl protease
MALLVAAVGACGKSGSAGPPISPLQMPVFSGGCQVTRGSVTAPLPISVKRVKTSATGVWILAGICVSGQGPFPFLVDTGASSSLVDTDLAKRLGLHDLIPPRAVSSFGCGASEAVAQVNDWSVGGLELPEQPVVVATVHSPVAPGLMGLLGADLLSRFGSVRFDYRASRLTLGGPDDGPLASDVTGAGRVDVPAAIRAGINRTVPLTIRVRSAPVPGADALTVVRPLVSVSIKGKSYVFTLDTGASRTVVSSQVASAAKLAPLGKSGITYAGLSCRVGVSAYVLPAWQLSGVTLQPETVFSNLLPSGSDGLLGSGTLQRYSPVVIDFADGELLLTQPAPRLTRAPGSPRGEP